MAKIMETGISTISFVCKFFSKKCCWLFPLIVMLVIKITQTNVLFISTIFFFSVATKIRFTLDLMILDIWTGPKTVLAWQSKTNFFKNWGGLNKDEFPTRPRKNVKFSNRPGWVKKYLQGGSTRE